jgi:hypothetical protein
VLSLLTCSAQAQDVAGLGKRRRQITLPGA